MRIWIIGAFLLSACATEAPPSDTQEEALNYTAVFFAGQKATEDERFLCEGVGGRVEKAGRLGAEHCVQDLPDAGEVCVDESECLGRCVIPDTDDMPRRGSAAKGTCEATDNKFGCTTLINGGVVEGTLCID